MEVAEGWEVIPKEKRSHCSSIFLVHILKRTTETALMEEMSPNTKTAAELN